jgi:hypothetical protein
MGRKALWTAPVLFALSSLFPAAAAWGHSGNPNYRSEIGALVPDVPGVDVQVLNYDDRLLLTNRSGKRVLVNGYDGEPYIRIQANGLVEVNKRSPSFYLNEDRFAQVEVPAEAKKGAAPRWDDISRTGRYEWHDHRIHWMSKTKPPQVKDEGKPTKISNWRVPLQVGSRNVELTGTLQWEPNDSGAPTAAYIALGAVAVASGLLVLASRRIRRRRTPASKTEVWG